jgi:hypothetical protein
MCGVRADVCASPRGPRRRQWTAGHAAPASTAPSVVAHSFSSTQRQVSGCLGTKIQISTPNSSQPTHRLRALRTQDAPALDRSRTRAQPPPTESRAYALHQQGAATVGRSVPHSMSHPHGPYPPRHSLALTLVTVPNLIWRVLPRPFAFMPRLSCRGRSPSPQARRTH